MGAVTAPQGLENVVVARTALSAIDGVAGKLSYAGYSIHDLAERVSFEEVFYLLLNGDLPTPAQLTAFSTELAALRTLDAVDLATVYGIPAQGHGMDALRTLVSALVQRLPKFPFTTEGATQLGMIIAAKMPGLIAAWHRARSGLPPVPADLSFGHAENVLWMLHGERPTPAATQALNTYMVLLAEHSLNASTFAARVAISAHSTVGDGMVAAIATLRGALHGGANQEAMETFLAIGTPENAAPYVDGLIERHERLMGVGHRLYKVEDPRVRHLSAQVVALAAHGQGAQWQAVADAVAKVIATHPHFTKRQLSPNVEFYSAPLLYALGFPLDLFTCAFAMSRIAGWTAHIREQIIENRLIRPKAEYSGPEPRAVLPLAER